MADRVSPFRRLRWPRRGRTHLDVSPTLPDKDADRLADHLTMVLELPERNTQRAQAEHLLAAHARLDDVGRRRFVDLLAHRFGTTPAAVDEAAAAIPTSNGDRAEAERRLRRALTPRYAELFHVITGLSEGVKFLVDLRAEMLALADRRDGRVAALDDELVGHLTTLFDVGLLRLERITWQSPASLLEKLIEYEAVHEIGGWDDLKDRLEDDRRCFAYFHPAMPEEPLVFVEIALTRGMTDELAVVLDRSRPVSESTEADTAIFYSITSCQPGLAGVNLGNELLKHVVERLRRELPNLRRFATLSPVPGFRRWLVARIAAGELTPGESERLGMPTLTPADLQRLLADDWHRDPALAERLRPGLLALCARYLTTPTERGRVADPVGNFHLSNGAGVARLNWMANPSPAGIEGGLGMMVNYRYDPDRIVANTQAYLGRGEVPADDAVRKLVAD